MKTKEAHMMIEHKIIISFIWNQVQLQRNLKDNSLSAMDLYKIGNEPF